MPWVSKPGLAWLPLVNNKTLFQKIIIKTRVSPNENKVVKERKEKLKPCLQRLKTGYEKARTTFKASENVWLWFEIHKFAYKLNLALS